MLIAFFVLSDLAISILYNTSYVADYKDTIVAVPFFVSLIFTLEYIFRISSAPVIYCARACYRARLKYMTSFFGLIDLLSVLPFVLPVVFGLYDTDLVPIFDLTRIFLVFKLARYSRSFREILLIFMLIRKELMATLFFIGVMLIFSSALMFYVESGAQPDVFMNLGESLWWGINTITSVGYGDIYPVTFWGKVVGGVTAFLGVLMFALPTALISSAFIKYYQRKT